MTDLTIIERAERALSFADTKAKLEELAKASAGITEITNGAGYEECHRARMDLKNTRVDIGKTGKLARDDANAFAKAVIEKEKELIAIIEPEEKRLNAIQTEWDEARRQEREAEAARKAKHEKHIENIRQAPIYAAVQSSAEISSTIAQLVDWLGDCSEFEEYAEQAIKARDEALPKLEQARDDAKAREDAKAKEEAERAAEEARLKAEREKLEAERKAEQERADAERAALAKEREQLEREKREAEEQRQREAAEKAAAEQAEANRIQREKDEQAAKEKAEAEARAKAQDEADIRRKIAELSLFDAAEDARLLLSQSVYRDTSECRVLTGVLDREAKEIAA